MIRNLVNKVMAGGGTATRGRGHRGGGHGRRSRGAAGGSSGARIGSMVERFFRSRR